jgi:hypothetical protein
MREAYRYTFEASVPQVEIQGTLALARVAAEGLHGQTQFCLEAQHMLAPDGSVCLIEVRGPAGRDFNRLFLNFIAREFGPDAYTFKRIDDETPTATSTRRPRSNCVASMMGWMRRVFSVRNATDELSNPILAVGQHDRSY